MIPFAIGIFTHIPLQVYLEARNQFGYTSGFFYFFANDLFHGVYRLTPNGVFPAFGHQLWFLVLLFVFSLILIGPFVLLRREKSYNRLLKVTSFLSKPGVIFAFVIPVILVEQIYNLLGTPLGLVGGYFMFTYIIFYFIGFLFAADERFKKSIEKMIIPALIGTIVFGVSMMVLIFYGFIDAVFWILFPIYGWCFVILILGLGSKYLNKNNKARKFMNELVMPFFILHQTIIVIIGYFVVDLTLSMFVKYLIIVSSSLLIIIVLLLIIKYLNPLRVLFGMRWKKDLLRRKPKAVATSPTEETSQVSEDETDLEK